MKISDEQRLKLISNLVEGDIGFEADCVSLDEMNGRSVTQKEKDFAKTITDIYTIVHPRFSECNHEEWEKRTLSTIKSLRE